MSDEIKRVLIFFHLDGVQMALDREAQSESPIVGDVVNFATTPERVGRVIERVWFRMLGERERHSLHIYCELVPVARPRRRAKARRQIPRERH